MAFKENPEMLARFRNMAADDDACRLLYALHENGYTVFDFHRLAWREVRGLMHGIRLANEENK